MSLERSSKYVILLESPSSSVSLKMFQCMPPDYPSLPGLPIIPPRSLSCSLFPPPILFCVVCRQRMLVQHPRHWYFIQFLFVAAYHISGRHITTLEARAGRWNLQWLCVFVVLRNLVILSPPYYSTSCMTGSSSFQGLHHHFSASVLYWVSLKTSFFTSYCSARFIL